MATDHFPALTQLCTNSISVKVDPGSGVVMQGSSWLMHCVMYAQCVTCPVTPVDIWFSIFQLPSWNRIDPNPCVRVPLKPVGVKLRLTCPSGVTEPTNS